jgi:hypothetical protein
MSPFLFACFNLVAFAVLCRGSEFLQAKSKGRKEHVSEDDIRASLLAEVESTTFTGNAANRVRLLEAIMKPMYVALPKNEHGNLGHSTVRYALHRLFNLRHGWHIAGLGRHAETANLTSPVGVLKDQVPAYIQNIFEKRLGDKGLGLQELSVMAATMEHLIHQEAVGKLGDVYNLYDILPTEAVNETKADELLDTYMMLYIIGGKIPKVDLTEAVALTEGMPEIFSGWRETQALVRRFRSNLTSDPQSPGRGRLSFDFRELSQVVAVVGEEYGTFQDIDCRNLKHILMGMEFRGTGRIKLPDFYKPSLDDMDGNWQFQENVGYLRVLGALDESDPDDVSVIIANYLHSQANCIATSGFYSVCCKDECEGLLGHVEEKLAAPEASATTISAIVQNLPSSTVSSPRDLSPTLLKRLDQIATEHGGTVPIHGRLFAQWMHHAYPRECPFPHLSGTASQLEGQDYNVGSIEDPDGLNHLATEEEMRQIVSSAKDITELAGSSEELLTWSHDEELLIERARPPSSVGSSGFVLLRPIMLMVLVVSLALSLVQAFRATRTQSGNTATLKYIV